MLVKAGTAEPRHLLGLELLHRLGEILPENSLLVLVPLVKAERSLVSSGNRDGILLYFFPSELLFLFLG